ncbi:MAG: PQQ-dependent sugar dehydrogenase [Nitrospira sp.]|nr:MAG: PQQ-dependent sugar dehydrogenase [Nitrospira sp.]
MTFAPHSGIVRSLALAGLALLFSGCIDSGSGGGGTTPTAQTGISISGTVSGTRIVAVNSSDQIIAEDDTAGGTPNAQGQFAWSLDNLPVGTDIRLFFITGGNVYPMFFGNPSSNVFAVNAPSSITLGHVTTAGTQATPQNPPTGVTPGPPNNTMPPAVTPTVTISSPTNNAMLPNGPVTVMFSTQNFTIGAVNKPHLHVYLDSDAIPHHFYAGSPGQVLYQGASAANVQWLSNSQILFNSLAVGTHQVRLVLANISDMELANAEATKTIIFSVVVQSGNQPSVTIMSPAQNASVPVGPVTVSFTTQFFTIGVPGQTHLHFYLDNDPVPYMFYNGAGINDDNGVLYNGVHTHFVHWKTGTSFDIFGLPSTAHQVRMILANTNHSELANPEATKTLNFSVSQPPSSDLQLQSVLPNLNFPVGMSLAPDGRVFFNERLTGRIRIINQQWQLVNSPFCQLTVQTSGEQGLLGLTLDPNFAGNKFVYVYYTAGNPLRNRVVRYTESSGACTQETVILDDIPASGNHNAGIIQFGPDGKLYIITGDAGNTANSQSLTSLAGKILRLNPDGSTPTDNPFVSNANANAKKVYALGIRNSYGFTFHQHTGHLWQTENGPGDSDEINRITSGGNYGWPTVRGIANNPNFRDPILAYTPTIAPTGIIAIPENSTVYPTAYRNNLLFVDFNGGKIRRVVLSGADLTQLGSSSIAYNGGNGNLLSLMLGADGFVYVSNTNAIFKVVPVP